MIVMINSYVYMIDIIYSCIYDISYIHVYVYIYIYTYTMCMYDISYMYVYIICLDLNLSAYYLIFNKHPFVIYSFLLTFFWLYYIFYSASSYYLGSVQYFLNYFTAYIMNYKSSLIRLTTRLIRIEYDTRNKILKKEVGLHQTKNFLCSKRNN